MTLQVHESAEDYLETILVLREQNGSVRSIDIVGRLGYSKPSVSNAMKKLRESDMIVMDSMGYITLTEAGEKLARSIYDRHEVLTGFLISIGVDEKTAREDACRIEHDLSPQSFEKIRKHINDTLK